MAAYERDVQRVAKLPEAPHDDQLQQETLPPVLEASAVLAGVVALITLIATDLQYLYRWVPVVMLCVSVIASFQLRRRGHWRWSAFVLAQGLGLACAASIGVFGVIGNPWVFGIVLAAGMAGMLLSWQNALQTALLNTAALVVAAFYYGVAPGERFVTFALIGAAGLMALGNAALGALAGLNLLTSARWALDAYAKSGRREEQLRATKAELERALRDRERLADALRHSNAELTVAREQAESAYRLKAFLMASLSHELRTPLNIIIGFSNAILVYPHGYGDVPLPEPYREDIDAIRRNSTHLLGLINDILDLARVEAGQLDLRRGPLQIAPLLIEAIEAAQGLPHAPQLQFVSEVASDLPAIDADEARVRQIVLNLLANAVKFTPCGSITLGARAIDEGVLVWVRDTGVGIALDDRARIFEPFQQASEPHDRAQGGTGLGLTICRWLIELHGGRMWLESEVGLGSTFLFTLPLHASPCPIRRG
jgi:signal transduction histidine kinase